MLQQRSWSAGVLANDTARGRKSTRLEIFHYSWRSSQFGGIFAQRRGKRKDVYKNHLGCWCAKLGTPPLAEPHVVRSYTGGHMADIQRISAQQAHAKSKANQALLVCAYEDEAKCRMLNLDGSISFASLQSRAASLPKTQEIIFY